MQEIEKLQKQIFLNHGFGNELIERAEFNVLARYLDSAEVLVSAIVCQIENQLYLVAFSNARLFIIQRSTALGSCVKRIGLEDIKDLELVNDRTVGRLIFSFYSSVKLLKLEGISLIKAQKFGRDLVTKIKT